MVDCVARYFLSAGTVQAEADAHQELNVTEAGAVRGTTTGRPIGDRAEVARRYIPGSTYLVPGIPL